MVGRSFEELVEEAERAPADGWNFGWLDGRATEARPTWRFFDLVSQRVEDVSTMLEVQAGVGAMIGNFPHLPRLAVAAEGFPPSLAVAAPRLRARGVQLVVTAQTDLGLPFAAGAFEFITSRHPVDVWWDEISRVLRPGGVYLAQHVGPHSLRRLSEFLMGPLPSESKRDPGIEARDADAAGLVVREIRVERPRTVFYDVGAVAYFLRLVPWIVPDFSVAAYRDPLRQLHAAILRDGAFETTASRMLVEASKPA
jgi:SAM-dependent methyltransferase